MELIKISLHVLKKSFEKVFLICLISGILLTSGISWVTILTDKEKSFELVTSGKSTNAVENKAVLFSGVMIVIAKYFKSTD